MRDIINILKYSAQLRRYYVVVSLFSIATAVITQIQPFLVKGVVDQFEDDFSGGPEANLRTLVILVVAYFVADFGLTIISNVGGYFGDMMTIKLRRYLSERFYQQLLSLPQHYFDNERTGALVNKLSRSIENLTQTIQMFSNNFLQLILGTVITFVVVMFYSWQVALLMIVLYPALLWMTRRTSEKWQEIELKKNKELDIAFGRFTEVIGQMRVVKSFRQAPRELGVFRNLFGKVVPLTSTQSQLWHRQDVARRFIVNIVFALIFGTVVLQTFNGDLDLGEMTLLLQYAALIRLPLFSLSFIVDNVQRAIAGSRDFFEIMNLEPEQAKLHAASEPEQEAANNQSGSETGSIFEPVERLAPQDGSVSFSDVSFAYEEEGVEVIQSISFDIPAGKKLALVAESGGGKTTIANLLMGLYRPTGGTISVGGRDVEQERFGWLREQVGVVFQDAELFSGTILENIAYASPEAPLEEVIAAAEAANAAGFISDFPDGYDTEIGERGIKLSGGQKQRIAIARAILKNAPILILDEATSALDSKAEIEVQTALDRLLEGRTSLIIAHRLSTIASVDQILTLRDGLIDEVGTPAELAGSGGIYAQLLQLQQADPEERQEQLRQFELS